LHVLVVYFSFTGQAERVATRIGEVLSQDGNSFTLARVAFADTQEPVAAPVPFSVISRWGNDSKKSVDVPIHVTPDSALTESYDLVVVLSNTWTFTACAPIQTFLRGQGAALLNGKPVAIGIVCRGFWKGNLALTKKLVAAAGGRFTNSEIFTHAGAWLTSTITNVLGMTKPTPVPQRFGPLRLPPFGVSPPSMAKIPDFVRQALALSIR
jgi:flavodoxin